MPRISFLIITLLIINSTFMFGQNDPIAIDLGVFNGEVGRVEREFNIHVMLPSSVKPRTGHRIELKRLAPDDQTRNTHILIQLELPKQIGHQLDTISFLSDEGQLLQEVHLNYQVLFPVSDLFKSYRNEYWPFKSKEQVFNLGIGTTGDTLDAVFDLLNFSGSNLNLNEIRSLDDLQVAFYPEKVQHNSFTRMELRYQSNSQSELGFQRYSVPLIHDGDTISFLPIQFSLIPKVYDSEARLIVNRDEFDFKVVKEGQEVTEVVFISNNGVEPLKILKVETNCDCLIANLSSPVVAPGDNAQLRIKFLSQGRSGLEKKTITLFTNDPQSPVRNISIKVNVK